MTTTLTKPNKIESFSLPDGDYYVGCPSLVIPEELWDEFCKNYLLDDGEGGIHTMNDYKFVTIHPGGDGCYRLYDKDNPYTGDADELTHIDSLSTDVGTLSIIPIRLLESLGCSQEDIEYHGFVFDTDGVDTDFDVSFIYDNRLDNRLLYYVEFLWYKLSMTYGGFEEEEDN